MVVVHELAAGLFGAFGVAAQVNVDFGTGAAGAGVAHLPEVVVLVAVDDMVSGHVALPVAGGFVVAAEAFVGRALEHCGVQALGVELEHVDKVFPGPVDGFLLEVIAEAPVAEHLEHGVMVGVHAHLFEVIVLAAHAQTLLRVGHTVIFCGFIAENNVFKLVHARIGEHQGGVILDYHGGRRHDLVSLIAEKVFERLAYFLRCQHVIVLC